MVTLRPKRSGAATTRHTAARHTATGALQGAPAIELPRWIEPQLTELVKEAPDGPGWLHEIKFDGYRIHARLDRGRVQLLTRKGLDWTHKYPTIAQALRYLPARQAYLDGELCGLRSDGTTSFDIIQNASEPSNQARLIFFLFDLMFVDGEALTELPLIERKRRLADLLTGPPPQIQYSDHQAGRGVAFHRLACERGVERIVSKRADALYTPGNRGLWLKTKCVNREEFVVVGWTDPEGSRPWLGSLLLAYYDLDGRLVYAGRAGSGFSTTELQRVRRRLEPLGVEKTPLDVLPPTTSRFGSPLVLSRVHWVRPELVAEVTFLTWTGESLLRQVVYQGLREDKPARGTAAGAERCGAIRPAGSAHRKAAPLAEAGEEPARPA